MDSRYRCSRLSSLLSEPSILPTSLKQLEASVIVLSVSSMSALLTRLPQLEILLLCDIGDGSSITSYTKTVLPRLRILQLIFSRNNDGFIVQFLQSLELPVLNAMSIAVEYKCPIPALPKSLSERLEYLGFYAKYNEIDAWEAGDFPNLDLLRLHGDQISSASFRSHLPMKQIIELTWRFPLNLTPKTLSTTGVVELAMGFLLDPSMTPKLHTLILDIGEATWDQMEKQNTKGEWLSAYFEALAASFVQRGVDLWFDRPHLLRESVLVRDMIRMYKAK
jgi:hypothetical protein